MTWFEAPTLENDFVKLEKLSLDHAPGLLECADIETFRYLLHTPSPWNEEGFREVISMRLNDSVPFAVWNKKTGRLVGSTAYLDPNREHRTIEVGYTWYAPLARGTVINPSCKLLLLQFAFESLNCIRVQLKCDNRNEASKGGILKLGAKFEGVLRNHRILADGHKRQTAFFSITDDEWPEVQERLKTRIDNEL